MKKKFFLYKKICIDCQKRRARFRFQGVVKWDKNHKLCFACFRAQKNRLRETIRAEKLARIVTLSGNFSCVNN
jgi:hypothetical protein